VPLSEHEQRLFEEIERSLAEAPKFASAVRAHDPRHHARRRLVLAAVALVAGLALLVYGAVSKNPLLGVCGFVVMLGAPAVVMESHRRAHTADLRAEGGSARRRPRRSSLVERLEERWRRRSDDR